MERSEFLNYLIKKCGIEVVNRNDLRDRTISLFNPSNARRAFLLIDVNKDYIDWVTIGIICGRLGVEPPPK